ncbi:MAG: SMC family ATPase [Hydrogenophaga sp.]|nr:SMC family ATPase [Hydrogenophaga sp.]
MKPIKLTLTGFAGIASGRSKQTIEVDIDGMVPEHAKLVAIAGPNGTGKTTLIDNMHPYRIMPSRANGGSVGSFSFYDHMVGGEALKELIWEHAGVRYQSSIRMRATAKTKRTEAYLLVINADGTTSAWSDPASGLQSDGKADTYDHCIESILGKPEVFFAAQFSAQGKTPISKMTASEVKKLLAQMLRMDQVAALSAKANEVVKSLRPHLSAEQEQSMRIRSSLPSEGELAEQLKQAEREVDEGSRSITELAKLIESALAEDVAIRLSLQKQTAIKAQHESLDEQIRAARDEADRQHREVQERHVGEITSLDQARMDAKRSLDTAVAMESQLRTRMTAVEVLLSRADQVARASTRLDELRAAKQKALVFIEDKAPEIKQIAQVTGDVQKLTEELAKLASDGKHLSAALLLNEQTSALLDEVPCKGSELAGQCMLLQQANRAQAELPAQRNQLEGARKVYRIKSENRSGGERVLQALQQTQAAVANAQEDLRQIEEEIARCREVLALSEQVEAAKLENQKLRQDLTGVAERKQACRARMDEIEQQRTTLKMRQDREMEDLQSRNAKAVGRLEQMKSALPALVDERSQDQVHQRLEALHNQKRAKEHQLEVSTRRLNSIKVEQEVMARRVHEAESHDLCAKQIATEMSSWILLSKALSTDGVIAMSIDDAGPAVSAIANGLLEECYGGRFIITIKTQEQTSAGLQRETFNVMVEDTLRGETKPLESMSGGEKVWINECLVRALALYMSRTGDARYETLFSDESDGPLDPERKRQYMAMKRRVLEVGGYEREFLITQTPELLNMCDAVIDVTGL